MKTVLGSAVAKGDTSALLDRGGRPTLRDLIDGLEFDPASATLRLKGERMTLQSAKAERMLYHALIRSMGEEEARIFLMRHGYRSGLADAAFIEQSWPGIDRGDAFTAGMRLHMFSGIVRVETLYNDFDFERGRFSGEFLWYNSIAPTGSDGVVRYRAQPQCWQQLGYASGYSSYFFGALVVYKESACAAQGHQSCRVIGRMAENWGEDDPDVRLFRDRILPLGQDIPIDRRKLPPQPTLPEQSGAALLRPIAQRLDVAARLRLSWLIAGRGNCGQYDASAALLQRWGIARERLRQVDGASLQPDQLQDLLGAASLRGAKGKARGLRERGANSYALIIDGAEHLGPAAQDVLLRHLRQKHWHPRLILTAQIGLADLAPRLRPALWSQLSPLACELSALEQRDDFPQICQERILQAEQSMGQDLPEGGAALLAQCPAADLDMLDGQILALMVAGVEGRDLAAVLQSCCLREPPSLEAPLEAIAAQMATGAFSLPAHDAAIRKLALLRADGNLAAAARLLGITRAQLAYRETAGKQNE